MPSSDERARDEQQRGDDEVAEPPRRGLALERQDSRERRHEGRTHRALGEEVAKQVRESGTRRRRRPWRGRRRRRARAPGRGQGPARGSTSSPGRSGRPSGPAWRCQAPLEARARRVRPAGRAPGLLGSVHPSLRVTQGRRGARLGSEGAGEAPLDQFADRLAVDLCAGQLRHHALHHLAHVLRRRRARLGDDLRDDALQILGTEGRREIGLDDREFRRLLVRPGPVGRPSRTDRSSPCAA